MNKINVVSIQKEMYGCLKKSKNCTTNYQNLLLFFFWHHLLKCISTYAYGTLCHVYYTYMSSVQLYYNVSIKLKTFFSFSFKNIIIIILSRALLFGSNYVCFGVQQTDCPPDGWKQTYLLTRIVLSAAFVG